MLSNLSLSIPNTLNIPEIFFVNQSIGKKSDISFAVGLSANAVFSYCLSCSSVGNHYKHPLLQTGVT